MTEQQLKEMEDLCEKATKGPWRLCGRREFPWILGPVGKYGEDTHTIVNEAGYGVFSVPTSIGAGHERDLAMFAASRTFIPQAIARIRELEAKVRRFEWEKSPAIGALNARIDKAAADGDHVALARYLEILDEEEKSL